MDMKTAMTIAMLFGAMVCGGVFITVAKDGHFLMGLVSGGLIGTVSGLMSLGVLSAFLKKEDKALIRAYEHSLSVKTLQISPQKMTFFKVGNSSIFQKNELLPIEFGREIARLGFQFGISQCGEYISREAPSLLEETFLKNVQSNPGFLQLLFTNLITGAFHCYAKVLLHADAEVLKDVESGIVDELCSTMPWLSKDLIQNHKLITLNFSIAIEREIKSIEENSSTNLLIQYASDFYLTENARAIHQALRGLSEYLSGLGSRFMAICQDDFQLQIISNG
ncbi:hypothetical protein ACMYR3_09250 [Ampullimonas aquatilis]|uniref:hypothetical protein n=1 Tax=Ampullimonas aquatilis TaxID=1341549 RepID=UPI003C77B932